VHNYALVITRTTGEFYTCKSVRLIRQDCFWFASSLQSDPELIKHSRITSRVEQRREESSPLLARNAALVIDIHSFKIPLVAFQLKPQDASRTMRCNAAFTLSSHVRAFQGRVGCISQVIQYETLFSSETFLSAAAFSNLLASSPMYDRVY